MVMSSVETLTEINGKKEDGSTKKNRGKSALKKDLERYGLEKRGCIRSKEMARAN